MDKHTALTTIASLIAAATDGQVQPGQQATYDACLLALGLPLGGSDAEGALWDQYGDSAIR